MFLSKPDAVLLVKLALQPGGQQVIKVVAAQPVVAVAGQDFGHFAFDGDDGDVKRSAAQIVDHHGVARAVCETVCEAGGGGFIEYAQHFEARQHTGFPGGVALRVREIRRHGDDGTVYRLAQFAACPVGQFLEDERGNLLGRESLASHYHGLGAAHFAFDAAHRALRVDAVLVEGGVADEQFPRRRDSHTRWQQFARIRPKHAHAVIHESGHFGIGGSQIDANYRIAHCIPPFPGRFATRTCAGRYNSPFHS